jgi:hypothetical protein
MAPRDDETVRVAPAGKAGKANRTVLLAASAAALAVLGGIAGWLMLEPAALPVVQAPTPAKPLFVIRGADERSILENRPADLDVFRLSTNPRILVLDFAKLSRQGAMLNRLAVMTEKAGQPRDRVLDDAELDRVIRAFGDTPETFYFGHDYGSDDLHRFFAAADRQKLQLTPDELWLRGLLEQEGLLQPNAVFAVISLTALDDTAGITSDQRATILHHEISHGEYFTNPAYEAWVKTFWRDVLDQKARDGFTAFLKSDNYDVTLPDLLANETQAYLMFTQNPRFFSGKLVGMDDSTIAAWRTRFVQGMPPGWLHDVARQATN